MVRDLSTSWLAVVPLTQIHWRAVMEQVRAMSEGFALNIEWMINVG